MALFRYESRKFRHYRYGTWPAVRLTMMSLLPPDVDGAHFGHSMAQAAANDVLSSRLGLSGEA